ncbi:MAG: hypothetical protein ACTSQZ_03755 [Candidatus Thorarchaeota archaeon]
MRKRSMGLLFVLLLVSAIVIGGMYVLLTQTELVDYNETVIIDEDTYSEAENISIYYDVCFHNVTFNVVDDPGFMIKINWKLTVLVDGAKGKNTNLQVVTSANGRYVSIQILKENPSDVCAMNRGEAEATVNVTINRAYTIDLEALAGHGNINLTATDASFDNIYFHHGINCFGNNGIYLTNTVVYEDLTCQVTSGNFFVRLESVDIGGTLSCTPEGSGTLIEL